MVAQQPELAARARRVDVGDGMEPDGNVEVLARGPEPVVDAVAQREVVDVGGRPDRDALEAEPVDRPLRLGHREFDVLQRHRGDAEQPLRRGAAVLGRPVVVGAQAVVHELDVVDRLDGIGRAELQRLGRVDDGGIEAVGVHDRDAGMRVVPATHVGGRHRAGVRRQYSSTDTPLIAATASSMPGPPMRATPPT